MPSTISARASDSLELLRQLGLSRTLLSAPQLLRALRDARRRA
jgi:hypothetical protein